MPKHPEKFDEDKWEAESRVKEAFLKTPEGKKSVKIVKQQIKQARTSADKTVRKSIK